MLEAPSPVGSSSSRANPCGLPVLGATSGARKIVANKLLVIADFHLVSGEQLLRGNCRAAAAAGTACKEFWSTVSLFFFVLSCLGADPLFGDG